MSDYVQITSTKNPIVQRFRAAATGGADGLMVADGVKLVGEALAAGCEFVEVATSPKLVAGGGAGRSLRRELIAAGLAAQDCSDDVMQRISHLTSHQGVAAVVRQPRHELVDLAVDGMLVVIAAGVKDPGNLGGIMRSAEAAGATGLVVLAGGAHPFRDKAVRGSAGSVFRLPVCANVAAGEVTEWLGGLPASLVIAEASGDDYIGHDFTGPTAVVVGGEGEGVPDEMLRAASARVRIPMRTPVESLNVAVAASVLLFEARRQRR